MITENELLQYDLGTIYASAVRISSALIELTKGKTTRDMRTFGAIMRDPSGKTLVFRWVKRQLRYKRIEQEISVPFDELTNTNIKTIIKIITRNE